MVLPAMPGFYHRPQSISDLVDFVVARLAISWKSPIDWSIAGEPKSLPRAIKPLRVDLIRAHIETCLRHRRSNSPETIVTALLTLKCI